MRQQLEHKPTTNLIRHVRDAHVEKREGSLQSVPVDHGELGLVGGTFHTLCYLADHSRVVLDRVQDAATLEELEGEGWG